MNMKKIIAFMLSLAVVLTGIIIPAYSAETELPYTEEQIELINKLSVIDRSYVEKYPNNILTRSSFAYYVERLAGTELVAANGFEAIYKDVTSEHNHYNWIKTLTENGFMNGFPDGTFRPDEAIASRDAAKVLLYCIGYKPYINTMGINNALNKTGILDGVGVKDEITVSEYVVLVYNLLHAPAIRMTGVDANGGVFELDESYLGLDHIYNIIYGNGIVTEVPGSRLARPYDGLATDEIKIADSKFIHQLANVDEYLGYNVNYYYKKGNDGKDHLFYIAKSSRNSEFVLQSDDIDSFNRINHTYTYFKGNDAKKVSITSKTNVIYNGIAYPAYTEADMVPAFGTVTLLDNNNDNSYDVVRIDNYEFYLVNGADPKKKTISDIREDVPMLEFDDTDELTITWDGDTYPFERIIKGDFLVIKRTKADSGYYRVNIDVRKDARELTEVENFNLKKGTLKGGGLDYTMWSKMCESDEESKKALVVGNLVTLYFCDGIVVRVEKGTGASAKYGYLVAINGEGDFSNIKTQFKLCDDKAVVGIYDMAKTIKIDGKTLKTYSDISTALAVGAQLDAKYYTSTNPHAQAVRYELSETGLLKSLDTIVYNEGYEDAETALMVGTTNEANLNVAYTDRGVIENRNMYGQNYSLYNDNTELIMTRISNITTMLQIPKTNRGDDDGYRVFEWDDSEKIKEAKFYNQDEVKAVRGLYVYADTNYNTPMPYTVRPIIVKSITVEIDENDDTVYVINAYSQKTEVTYYSKKGDIPGIENVAVGDMIRAEVDSEKHIIKFQKFFDAATGRFVPSETVAGEGKLVLFDTRYPDLRPLVMHTKAMHVVPIEMKNGILRVTTSTPLDGDYYDPTNEALMDNLLYGSTNFYKYTMVRGEAVVEPATTSDIVTYKANNNNPSEMILVTYNNGLNYAYVIDKGE